MRTIFFDLETTDLRCVGQILNYAFVCVDKSWKPIDTLHGNIRISPTQLPMVQAILANRVDVIKHQQSAEDTESEAMVRIKRWLDDMVENSSEPVKLIGFNSIKFDLPFLRTSLIRNGISPYHPNLRYGDLLHVAQKLAVTNTDFIKKLDNQWSLKLSRLCQLENLLKRSQQHESLADVWLTIELAKHYAEIYGIDVRTHIVYEPQKVPQRDAVFIKVSPKKDNPHHLDEYANNRPRARMVRLDEDKNYALWVDVDLWAKGAGRNSISWYAKAYSPFFVEGVEYNEDILDLAVSAKEDLKHINLKNFFPERNCDIEQFIYMMKFDELDALVSAIWSKNLSYMKHISAKYASKLYLRYLTNNAPSSPYLKEYALYRYGGKMKTDKMDTTSHYQEGKYHPAFHPTYNEMLSEIVEVINGPNVEDAALARSLKLFYEQSTIFQVAGNELLAVERK